MKRSKQRSAESRELYRYWVEIKSLANGEIRKLPLCRSVHLIVARKGKPVDEQQLERLVAQDDHGNLEAPTFEELRTLLRDRYPDEAYERRLFFERDHEAEAAMERLARIFARAALNEMLREAGLPERHDIWMDQER